MSCGAQNSRLWQGFGVRLRWPGSKVSTHSKMLTGCDQ